MRRLALLLPLALALAGAAVWAAPGLKRKGEPAAYDPVAWDYPGQFVVSDGRGGGDVGVEPHRLRGWFTRRRVTTPDTFAKVVEFYRTAAGRFEVDFAEDSFRRPLELAVLQKRFGPLSVVVAISRGKDEPKTHIEVIVREPMH